MTDHLPPPYFDPETLMAELAGYVASHGSADKARPAVIERLKALYLDARAAAEADLLAHRSGRQCAAGLSDFQDAVIHILYRFATTHVYRAENPSDAERMTIVATGGYGRGLLAPGSDIDLLFLLPYKQTPWGESVAEYMLYVLWDLGLKVGHATRTVDQCIKFGQADHTVRTALLDMRLVKGDSELFGDLSSRFEKQVVKGTAKEFIAVKMAERDERHRRSGASRYRVEPNIKDGKGGLRDLHTLHWLAKYAHDQDLSDRAAGLTLFAPEELATFRRCEDFLWTVRCHLHFVTGRPEERLSFDVQRSMAERLRYRARGALLPVERFMKHYFLVAKEVGDLTAALCSALEMQQLKSAPRINEYLNPLTWSARRRIRQKTDFKIENERLNVAMPTVFANDPVNLLRIFAVAEETGTFLHPNALRLVRHSLWMIDDKLRSNKDANEIFLNLLMSPSGPETVLRHMNEAGVLGRFVPDFGKVISMMQFNMYHHYTVDEHLLRTVGELRVIEEGKLADTLPLATEIVGTIKNRRALYLAAFLHDIAKGRPEDHSIAGARIARELGPRLGLSSSETELAAWLVQEHLTMSNVSQSRDLADPKTIGDFADVVQSLSRLKLLLLLTVADIRAVGPGTWNGWKGQLLRELYWETEPRVSGGHTALERRERIKAAQAEFRSAMAEWTEDKVQSFIARQYDHYWLKTDAARQADHARLLDETDKTTDKLGIRFKSDRFTSIAELSVVAPNHPRLLALFAGACAAAGAEIIGAQVSTTRDGLALDTFLLKRAFELDDDENRRLNRISKMISKVLKGETWLDDLMRERRPVENRIQAFDVEPELAIDNALSDNFTVIEASARDRIGLLYDLTSAISDLNLDITSAHITTYGEKAVDVFYVTDLTGKKVVDTTRQEQIRERLDAVLDSRRLAAA
ncbi:MAG: hypothetical protein RLZ98_1660 [Pseudomonadota bacterium]|jgi:[protein-PII] uridylyltransferase